MMNIKLLPDYYCSPIWCRDTGANIELSDLPISESLSLKLQSWADAYDSTLNNDDPLNSGFESESDVAAFIEQAAILCDLLKHEMGNLATVEIADSLSKIVGVRCT